MPAKKISNDLIYNLNCIMHVSQIKTGHLRNKLYIYWHKKVLKNYDIYKLNEYKNINSNEKTITLPVIGYPRSKPKRK